MAELVNWFIVYVHSQFSNKIGLFSKRDSERRLATGLFDRRALVRAMIRNDLDSVLALPFIGQVCAQAAHATHPTTSRRARERETLALHALRVHGAAWMTRCDLACVGARGARV